MKKRIIITAVILCLLFFAYKKVSDFFSNDEIDENVFATVKSQNSIIENWLIYIGVFLILISIVGIVLTIKSINFKNKKGKASFPEKNKDFENLYS